MVPYMLAWESPYEGWMFATMLFSALFWLLDIVSHFMIGYVRDYQVQLSPIDIIVHYMRTGFLVDLFFVCSDFVSLFVLYDAGASGTLWVFNAMRALKAGRLMKIWSLLNACSQIINDEKYHSLMIFAVILAGALWFNHIMGCAWHAIGTRADADTSMYWIETVDLEYMESSELYQYLSSLHWSVATFLGGNVEMYCRNSIERAVSIGYTMAGLMYGSTLISLLSAALVDRNEARKLQTQRLVTLRRFLRERKIDQRIAILVQQQITERIGKKEALSEKEVDSLGYLSKALWYEPRLDMFSRYITTHPLFDLWFDMDKRALQPLCADTLDFQDIRAKDDLFAAGTQAVAAYTVIKGSFQYAIDRTHLNPFLGVRKLSIQTLDFVERLVVELGVWLAEACLWADWKHTGTAEALEMSQVLTVTGEGISRAMTKNPHVHELTMEYCKLFPGAIINARPPEAYPDDLQVPHAGFSNLVLTMNRDIQIAVGMHAIAKMKVQVRAGWGRSMMQLPGTNGKLDTLRTEVESGKSTVMVTAKGEVERFVSLVAVRLVNEERQLLVQLAKQENEQEFIKPDCALPAQKKPSGVSVEDSLERILADKLSDFTGDTEPTVEHVPQPDVRVEESKLFGIKTTYLRYVCTVLVGTNTVTGTIRPMGADAVVRSASVNGSVATRGERLAKLVEEMGAHRALLDRKVHSVGADGKMTWYAWVSEDEFAFLERAEAKPLLRRWLAVCALALDQDGRPFFDRLASDGGGALSPRQLPQRLATPWQALQSVDDTLASARSALEGVASSALGGASSALAGAGSALAGAGSAMAGAVGAPEGEALAACSEELPWGSVAPGLWAVAVAHH